MARPSFKPTVTLRRRVAIAAGGGMSHEEIAIGLGISRPTLEKHFAQELSFGAYARRIEVMEAMHTAAKKGNVAAQKAYVALTPRVAAPPLPAEPEAAAQPKPEGKKAEANAAAKVAQVGTDWDALLSPRVQLQ